MKRLYALSLILSCGLWLSASATQAQSAGMQEAQQRYVEGVQLFEGNDFSGALVEFQRAYELLETEQHERRFLVLFSIGNCLEGMHRYSEAVATYQRFLQQSPPNSELRGQVQSTLQQLNGRLATLQISTNVENAAVWVDGRLMVGAVVPGSIVVDAGEHVLELRADGYQTARHQYRVPARTTAALTLNLTEIEGGLSGLEPALVYTGIGLTAVAAAVGGIFGIMAIDQHGQLTSRLSMEGPERYLVTQDEIDAMAEQAMIADIIFGVAGALGVATVVMLFLTDWEADDAAPSATAWQLIPWGTPQGGGLQLRGSF